MLGCRLLVTAPSHPTRIRYPSGHLQRAKRRLDRLACLDHRDGPPGAAAAVAQHQLQVARGGCACCSGPAVEVGSASRRAVEAAAAGQPLEQRGHPDEPGSSMSLDSRRRKWDRPATSQSQALGSGAAPPSDFRTPPLTTHGLLLTRDTQAQNVHLRSKVRIQVTHQPRF